MLTTGEKKKRYGGSDSLVSPSKNAHSCFQFIPSADAYWQKRRLEQEAAHNAAESAMLRERQKARYEVRYRMRRYEHDKLQCEPEMAALTDCYNKSSKTTLNCATALDTLISCIDVKRRQRLDDEDASSRVCGPKHGP